MKAEVLIYIGAALPFLWGAAHLFPTRSIIQGFGDISADNRHIITMEWLIEGAALIFIGSLVALVTFLGPQDNIATAVYLSTSACLLVLAVISLFTGFRINFLPFKLCPFIFASAAILITTGWKIL